MPMRVMSGANNLSNCIEPQLNGFCCTFGTMKAIVQLHLAHPMCIDRITLPQQGPSVTSELHGELRLFRFCTLHLCLCAPSLPIIHFQHLTLPSSSDFKGFCDGSTSYHCWFAAAFHLPLLRMTPLI